MTDKKQIPVKYNKDFEVFFTDIVKIDVNPETVSLTFGIKSGEKAEIEVTHRAIMTLPHYFRFVDVCNRIAKDINSNINNSNKKTK